jgi:hypothetical protein
MDYLDELELTELRLKQEEDLLIDITNMTKEEKIKIAENNKHIPSNEIEQDIRETEAEILIMEKELKGYRAIGDRMSHFRANARENGIEDRKEFIEKLKAILEIRNA